LAAKPSNLQRRARCNAELAAEASIYFSTLLELLNLNFVNSGKAKFGFFGALITSFVQILFSEGTLQVQVFYSIPFLLFVFTQLIIS
jgi:hypothetical protein